MKNKLGLVVTVIKKEEIEVSNVSGGNFFLKIKKWNANITKKTTKNMLNNEEKINLCYCNRENVE